MITTSFKQVLRECARSQSVNPDGGSFTQEYADELAESISNRVGLLWTQEFWPFAMTTEQRKYRPEWDSDEICLAGTERFWEGEYYVALRNCIGVEPGATGSASDWKLVLEVTNANIDGYEWDPYLAWDQQADELRFGFVGSTIVAPNETLSFASMDGDNPVFQGDVSSYVSKTVGVDTWTYQAEDDSVYQAPYTNPVPPTAGWVNQADNTDVISLTLVPGTFAGEDFAVIPEDGIELDEFLYNQSPATNAWARPVRDLFEDETGVHVVALRYPAEPWIRFRKRPPQFTAELYSANISYAAGYVVYAATTGECYRSLADANLGNALTNTTYWERQQFPAVFLPAVKMFARAEHLHNEENFEAGFAMEGRAGQLMDKLVDDFFESGARTRRARVVNR